MSQTRKSVYFYAAEDGIQFGLYLSILSFCLLGSVRVPQLPILIIPLVAGIPFILWRFMKKIWRRENNLHTVSAMWIGGISLFIFGSLVCGLVSATYILLLEPDFIINYVNQTVSTIENSTMAADYAIHTEMMHRGMEKHLLPTSMQFVLSMVWVTSFIGSVFSLLCAIVFTKVQTRSTDNNFKD